MTVNRYHVDCYAFYDSARLDVTKCDDGDYVLFEDHAATQARVEKLEAALAGLLSRVQNDCDAKTGL